MTTRRRRIAKVTLQPKPRVPEQPIVGLSRQEQAKTLFGRLQMALDVPFQRVAEILGVTPGELLELQTVRNDRLGDLDAICERALAYINERLAMGIALRGELEARLYEKRQAAMARRERIRGTK